MKLSIAKPGSKAVVASTPQLNTTPTVNKFSINPLTSKLLGVQHGDHVSIIVNDAAETIDEMYFLAQGVNDSNQSKLAAVNKAPGVGRVLNFNYSGVWSKMLQFSTEAVELSLKALVERELAVERVTKDGNPSFTATKKVTFNVGEGFEYDLGGSIGEVTLYPLVDAKIEDYTPRDNEGTEEGED